MMKHAGRVLVVFGALSVAALAGAQSVPPGQATPPGTQNHTGGAQPCATDPTGNPLPQAQADANCTVAGPGFATPSTNTPPGDRAEHHVTAIVRVDAAVPKPATVPFPMDFSTIGNVTMVKARLPRVQACFTAGQIWSNRSGAATSTTCLDHKGVVIAYQECKAKVGDAQAVCTTTTPQQSDAAAVAARQ
ncbi:hypothetical protein Terro_3255 [Terriglobus roseus DSM 18391]|uniref:Uncharacterized protein n=1 Tax=Terriglobus roseus (strain DSM 18391 / NRRL B-41598 / KBS 63) TaxID=926566 RepID=I3ZJQ5_TERRK|nr:hypothetical protein [Terriglobus roseus]AFL89473.1 hypothetical protein Terro_3255 [Terriglobus roseus DSM 18391]